MFNVVIYDSSVTYITTVQLDNLVYILKDPALKVILPAFISNKPYIQP